MSIAADIDVEAHSGRRPGVAAWAMLAPLLAWLLLLIVLPTAVIVVFSFCRRGELGGVIYDFTLDNYRLLIDRFEARAVGLSTLCGAAAAAILWVVRRRRRWLAGTFWFVFWAVLNGLTLWTTQDPAARPWLKISVVSINYAAAATATCVLLGYPVAYFIGRSPARWRNLLLMSIMVPFWTSFLVRTYAWVTILRDGGVLNTLLLKVGLIGAPLNLYPSQTAVMIALIYTYLPFMILPIYTSVERLDDALVEAAFDLGASPLRAFRNVVLPLTMPGITAGVVLTFVPAVGMFAVNDILSGRGELLLGNLIERQFLTALDKPFGSAIGMLLLVLFVVTYALSQRRRPA